MAEQEARAAADAVSDNKPFPVRSRTGVCLACAPGDLIPSAKEFFVNLADSKWRSKLLFGGEESEIVYVLRDGASGEYLKVGKTTVTKIFRRFGD